MNWFITCIHSHIPGLKNVRYNFGYKNIKLVCGVRRNTLKILWSSTSQDDKKLRRETLQEKKGRGKVQSERKGIMELELDLLRDLTMEDKSSLSISLQNLDKGSLVFPIPELLRSSVLKNKELGVDFSLLIAALSSAEVDFNSEVVHGVFKALVSN